MIGVEVLDLPPRTLEELAALDSGLILITGERGSGKTRTCEAILRYWQEAGLNYRHFGYQPAPRPKYGGKPHPISTLMTRIRGYRRILVDEPDPHLLAEEIMNGGLLVLATSEPLWWMIDRASWVVRVSNQLGLQPGFQHTVIEQGRFLKNTVPPTVWERLLVGVL